MVAVEIVITAGLINFEDRTDKIYKRIGCGMWEVEVTRFLIWTTENMGYHLLRWGRYEVGASFVEKNDDLDLLYVIVVIYIRHPNKDVNLTVRHRSVKFS